MKGGRRNCTRIKLVACCYIVHPTPFNRQSPVPLVVDGEVCELCIRPALHFPSSFMLMLNRPFRSVREYEVVYRVSVLLYDIIRSLINPGRGTSDDDVMPCDCYV